MDWMAWSESFPPLNLYNHPSYAVMDVWAEAEKLGLVAVPERVRQLILYGENSLTAKEGCSSM